jgi:hypothetical protein
MLNAFGYEIDVVQFMRSGINDMAAVTYTDHLYGTQLWQTPSLPDRKGSIGIQLGLVNDTSSSAGL